MRTRYGLEQSVEEISQGIKDVRERLLLLRGAVKSRSKRISTKNVR